MGENVRELQCFSVGQQNYLHPSESFKEQKYKAGRMIQICNVGDWFGFHSLSVKAYRLLYLTRRFMFFSRRIIVNGNRTCPLKNQKDRSGVNCSGMSPKIYPKWGNMRQNAHVSGIFYSSIVEKWRINPLLSSITNSVAPLYAVIPSSLIIFTLPLIFS